MLFQEAQHGAQCNHNPRRDAPADPNTGRVVWPVPAVELAAVDKWIGLPRAEWEDSPEKWDFEQGRVPGPEEEFSEPRAGEAVPPCHGT